MNKTEIHSEISDNSEIKTLLGQIENIFDENNEKDIIAWINNALLLAEELHKWQIRKSWEEYFIHPLRVTIKLIESIWEELDNDLLYKLIISSILHDTIEDTQFEISDVENHFWKVIAHSVKLLSKELWSEYIENEDEKEFIEVLIGGEIIDNKLKFTKKAKDLKKSANSEEMSIFFQFEEIEVKYKEIRNKDYFKKLSSLFQRNYQELDLWNLTDNEKEELRDIIIPIKWMDRHDNLETMNEIKLQKMIIKIRETFDEILPILEDWPEIIKILRYDIAKLISYRIIYISKPGE